jgi:hypothetical protein
MMGLELGDFEIVLGILLIFAFTLFAVFLNLPQPAATTTTTTEVTTTSTTTTTTTTTSRTTTSAASTSSSTTAATTTTTMFRVECAADIDCGKEHYDGTYICLPNEATTALRNCTPKCVHGACTEKCETLLLDKCNQTEVCIPGWRRCVDRDKFKNVSAKVEVFPDKYATYRGYQFRLNYTAYLNEYEVRLLLIDIITPGGGRDQTIAMWDMPTTLDDMEVGIYGVKRDSAIIWLQKIVNESE